MYRLSDLERTNCNYIIEQLINSKKPKQTLEYLKSVNNPYLHLKENITSLLADRKQKQIIEHHELIDNNPDLKNDNVFSNQHNDRVEKLEMIFYLFNKKEKPIILKTYEVFYKALINKSNEPNYPIEETYKLLFKTWLFINSDNATFEGKPIDKQKRSFKINPEIAGNSDFSNFQDAEITFDSKLNGVILSEDTFKIDIVDWINKQPQQSLAFKAKYNQFIDYINKLGKPISHKRTETIKTEKQELHSSIFKSNAFLIFDKYYKEQDLTASNRTDLRLLFELFKIDGLFVDTVELKHYIVWLDKHIYYTSNELKSINMETRPNIKRTNDYKRIKDDLKLTL